MIPAHSLGWPYSQMHECFLLTLKVNDLARFFWRNKAYILKQSYRGKTSKI